MKNVKDLEINPDEVQAYIDRILKGELIQLDGNVPEHSEIVEQEEEHHNVSDVPLEHSPLMQPSTHAHDIFDYTGESQLNPYPSNKRNVGSSKRGLSKTPQRRQASATTVQDIARHIAQQMEAVRLSPCVLLYLTWALCVTGAGRSAAPACARCIALA